jgi:hypothetical protein
MIKSVFLMLPLVTTAPPMIIFSFGFNVIFNAIVFSKPVIRE